MTPKPLPDAAQRLCAPPRLIAHLTLVHDTACELLDRLVLRFPLLEFDADAVRFGAATHDLGKVLVPEELDGPGSRHEELGYILLGQHGIAPSLALPERCPEH
jgi:HD superfamily phosphodiesterase